MKVLFVGLGSIGSRHLRNLQAACEEDGIVPQVTALRATARPLPDDVIRYVDREIHTVDEAEDNYDIAFITNPTNLHAETLAALQGRVGTFFIEKPIFDTPTVDLAAVGLGPGQKAYVAAPMRFTGVYLALRQRLNVLSPCSVRAICSSYLPSWRPGTDYRDSYSARQDMGGGVALDLVHEWDYLVDLFGMPDKLVAMRGKFSDLEIDADDLAVYLAKYPTFLCELHLDYFGRQYKRDVEVFTDEGSLCADFGTGLLRVPGGDEESYAEPVNMRYRREMRYFLAYAAGDETESINSPQRAVEIIKLALGEM